MTNFKKFAAVLAVSAVALVPFAVSAQYEDINADKNTINIIVDGERVIADNFLYNDTTYVQLRKIAEMLGKKVEWQESESAAYISDTDTPEITDTESVTLTEKAGSVLNVERNAITIYVNGAKVEADNFVFEGRTYVPLRKISEMLLKDVSWDQLTNTATIGKNRASVFDGTVLGTINGREYTDTLVNSYKTLYELSGTLTEEDDVDVIALEQIKQDYAVIESALEMGIVAGVSVENSYQTTIENAVAQLGSKEAFDAYLTQNGFNEPMYHYNYILNSLYTQMISNERFAASEEEIAQYYETNKETVFAYDGVRAKHILIMPESDEEGNSTDDQWKAAEEKAKEVYKLAKDGKDFDELIAEYNMDPGMESHPDGYTFAKGEMVIEFEEKCYSMEDGEISEPVKTEYGYHVIKLEEKLPYFELDDAVEEYIKSNLSMEKFSEHIMSIAGSAEVVENK